MDGSTTQPGGRLTSLAEVTASEARLRTFLTALPPVDPVGLERRAAALARRAVVGSSRHTALEHAITMVDLTTLEGADTPRHVRALAAAARRPDPEDPAAGPVAAVCVYPDLVATAVDALGGSTVGVASVATGFPSGRTSRRVKLLEVQEALAAGAREIDMVLDRGTFLAGGYGRVLEEIRAVKQACGSAHLKVILETGELGGYDEVRRASWLALVAGADFVKTSTGKLAPAATPPAVMVMLAAVRDFAAWTGHVRGVKVAGGLRTADDAVRYLVLCREIAGEPWLRPSRFRLGASSLLEGLVRARRRSASRGHPDHASPAANR